jgi:uncharacterized protein YlxP (DUF503 family)
LKLTFKLHGNRSLKGKRSVAASIKRKLRNKFNVAVAETEFQDSHETLVLSVVTVAGDYKIAQGRMAKVQTMIDAASPEEIVDSHVEYFSAETEFTEG